MILHVVPWQLSLGGAQRVAVELANWADAFAEVHILHKPPISEEWVTSATLHAVGTDAAGVEVIRQLQPDLIHHHFPAGGWLLSQCERYPIVGTDHGWAANSQSQRKPYVIPIAGPHQRKIPNGAEVSKYEAKVHTGTDCTMLLVGRRYPEKVPESFTDCCRRRLPRGRWIFVGYGYRNEYSRRVSARLEQLPIELRPDVEPLFSHAIYPQGDILVMPSATECCPLVAIEGMASGLPIVYRAVGGLPEVVGGAGIGCQTDDEIMDAVEWLRDAPSMRQQLGCVGRSRAESLFDLQRMFRQYAYAYAMATGGEVPAIGTPDPRIACSVVIPVYNTPPVWLHASLSSALRQDAGRYEVIVVDDGSTDQGTLALLEQYRTSVRLIRQEHAGCGPACNAGLAAARAEIILRHDSDDIMAPGRIARQVEFMQRNPSIAVSAGQMSYLDSLERTHLRLSSQPLWKQGWAIAHPTVAMRRSIVLQEGGYRPGLVQDLDLWCRLNKAGYGFAVLPDLLCFYRRGLLPEKRSASREAEARIRLAYADPPAMPDEVFHHSLY